MKNKMILGLNLIALCFMSGCTSINDNNNPQVSECTEAHYIFADTLKTISIKGDSARVDLIIDASAVQTTVHVKKCVSRDKQDDTIVNVFTHKNTLNLQEIHKNSKWFTTHSSGQVEYTIVTPYSVDIKTDTGTLTFTSRGNLQDIEVKAGTATLEHTDVKNITVRSGTVIITAPLVSGNVKVDAGTFKGEIGIVQFSSRNLTGRDLLKTSTTVQSVVLKTGTATLTLIIPTDTYVPLDNITTSPAVMVNSQVPTIASAQDDRHYPLNLKVGTGSGQITIVPGKA